MIDAIARTAASAAAELAMVPLKLTYAVIQALDPRESKVEIDVRYYVRAPRNGLREDLERAAARERRRAEAEADDREFE